MELSLTCAEPTCSQMQQGMSGVLLGALHGREGGRGGFLLGLTSSSESSMRMGWPLCYIIRAGCCGGYFLPGGITGQYLERDVPPPSPPPPRGRFLKCTKTEEFYKKSNAACHIRQVRQGKCGCAVVVGGRRGNRSGANLAPKWQQSVPGSSRV